MLPVNDITATLLYDILEVSAPHLIEKYKKHFLVLLHVLHQQYLEKIWQNTIEGSGGPIDRLETFLKKIIENPSSVRPPRSSTLKSGLAYL